MKNNDKNLYNVETEGDLKDAINNLTDYIEQEDAEVKQKKVTALAFWATSFMLHAITLSLMALLVYTVTVEPEQELPPVKISSVIPLPPKVKDHDKDKIRDILEKVVLIESEKESDDKGPVSNLDIPEDLVTSTEDENNNTDVAKGREEAKSDVEMGGQAFFNFTGAGSNASGMFGSRTGGGKNRAKAKMGPYGKETDSSTDAGLRWLMRHQSPNGMWSATKYFNNCTLAVKCEPGKDASGDEDVAMTGYSVLCFLGAGHDHKTPGRYNKVVKNGINYLISIQKPDGLMGERNYEHAVATMALVEAYGMSNDIDLRKPAQLAIDVMLSRQGMVNNDEYGRVGWDYVRANPARSDISVTGWNLMALKSASAAGFNVGNSLDGAKKFIVNAWKSANPDWEKKIDPYKDSTVFPYTYNALTEKTDREHLSFVGATCAVFLGHRSGDLMLETLLNDSEKRWIDSGAYKTNSYANYYLGLVMFQAGPARWQKYLHAVVPYVLETQKKSEDCLDGSWDYAGQTWHGADTSRVLSTTYNILNLEVAYRYAQVNGGLEVLKKKK